MGFKDMSSGENDFVKFREGDNAIVQLSQLDIDTGNYQGEEYQQLEMRFDAVNETDESEKGTIPGWVSSKITIAESDEHKSDLGKLLTEAGVLREVVESLADELGASSEYVDKVVNGETRFVAEDGSENEVLGKAVANALDGKRLRVGTSLNSGGDYSVVKTVHGTAASESGQEVLFEESD